MLFDSESVAALQSQPSQAPLLIQDSQSPLPQLGVSQVSLQASQ